MVWLYLQISEMHARVCVCAHVRACVGVCCVRMVCACVHMVCACMCACARVVHVCVCARCVCVSVCVCMCVHACVCVCVFLHHKSMYLSSSLGWSHHKCSKWEREKNWLNAQYKLFS